MKKAVFINGSPRKNKNTAQMLQKAMEGAKLAGAEVKMYNLYEHDYKGCLSCFACKRKGNKANGLCAIKDGLHEILEEVVNADVLVVGSPVYDSFPTGMTRTFIERLVFPAVNYNDYKSPTRRKKLRCGTIYTMNAPENLMKSIHYDVILGESASVLDIFGYPSEMLCSYETYQFNDYSKYETAFDEKERAHIKATRFPIDLHKAFEMGKRLVELAE